MFIMPFSLFYILVPLCQVVHLFIGHHILYLFPLQVRTTSSVR